MLSKDLNYVGFDFTPVKDEISYSEFWSVVLCCQKIWNSNAFRAVAQIDSNKSIRDLNERIGLGFEKGFKRIFENDPKAEFEKKF